MQYIALIYSDPAAGPKPETPEFGAMMKGYMDANEVYQKDGVFVAGEPLHGTDQATSIRTRNGKTETMDGPFAETKEALGGFYIFECEDLDAAIKYASLIPTVEYGTVEVRPIMVIPGVG